MIAAMPDFERIDRELAAIGRVPEAVQPLLDQYGQRDRSLENVDQVLTALKDGRESISSPPEPERPSFLPLGWDADRKSEPGGEAAPVALLEREEITVTSGAPEEMEPRSNGIGSATDAEIDAASEPPPAPDEAPIDTQEASPPPPPDDPPASVPEPVAELASEPLAAAQADDVDALAEPKNPQHRPSRPPRADLQALLDAELDPREFPSTTPPPPRMSRSSLPPTSLPPTSVPQHSLPPPLPSTSLPPLAGASAPAAQDGDFELLVDDDDILEIDESSE
jgi:hypothetical protein